MLINGSHGITNHLAFLLRSHSIGVTGVVDAVAEELPVTFLAGGNNLRMVLAQGRRQRDRAPYAITVQHAHLSVVPDPVPIVTNRVTWDAGMRCWPGFSMRVGRWIEFIELNVRCHPECDA